ncbi:MAG: nucleoside deaminase [Candidatus Bipolaricaulia bacterium]
MDASAHEPFVRRCIELAQEAIDAGDHPFGSVIVQNNETVVEGRNRVNAGDVTAHAEVEGMRRAQRQLDRTDLSDCVIYSNCEPCPMCSFMIRELKLKEVVFALSSPDMGGYSRWNILQDEGLVKYAPAFTTPPTVTTGVLAQEAADQFECAGWTIHGR